MKKTILFLGVAIALVVVAGAVATPAQAGQLEQASVVARGEYLASIMGCIGCHTPFTAEGQHDVEREFSGGRAFELGPLGTVFSKNLTSDVETGLGEWTDEEIKTAITTGISKDGLHLFPLMPYLQYNRAAESDINALVAFLRTLDPIRNVVVRDQILPSEALPQITYDMAGTTPPDGSDQEVLGEYILTIAACTDCHTPVNAETGAPEMDKFLGGGQPFEGPFGVVYGGNITPNEETGIGTWTADEIKDSFTKGILPDGRVPVVMPAFPFEYGMMTDQDADALVYYLQNHIAPVNRTVPESEINPDFIIYVEVEEADTASEEVVEEAAEAGDPSGIVIVIIGVILVTIVGMIIAAQNQKPKEE